VKRSRSPRGMAQERVTAGAAAGHPNTRGMRHVGCGTSTWRGHAEASGAVALLGAHHCGRTGGRPRWRTPWPRRPPRSMPGPGNAATAPSGSGGPRAGHTPGARRLPCCQRLGAARLLPPAARLREAFRAAGVADAETTLSSCVRGIAACRPLPVAECLGPDPGGIYAGSRSQYSQDPARPVDIRSWCRRTIRDCPRSRPQGEVTAC